MTNKRVKYKEAMKKEYRVWVWVDAKAMPNSDTNTSQRKRAAATTKIKQAKKLFKGRKNRTQKITGLYVQNTSYIDIEDTEQTKANGSELKRKPQVKEEKTRPISHQNPHKRGWLRPYFLYIRPTYIAIASE